jgi:hypothetical protein
METSDVATVATPKRGRENFQQFSADYVILKVRPPCEKVSTRERKIFLHARRNLVKWGHPSRADLDDAGLGG